MEGTPGITLTWVFIGIVTAVGVVICLILARSILLLTLIPVISWVGRNTLVGTMLNVTTIGRGRERQVRRSRRSRLSSSTVRPRLTVPGITRTQVGVSVTMPVVVDVTVTNWLEATTVTHGGGHPHIIEGVMRV